MGVIITIADARTRLAFMCQASVSPTLTTDATTGDIDQLLAQTIRATVWAASTAYLVGDKIIPKTGRTGRMFRCIKAGTSGVSNAEPIWSNVNAISPAVLFDNLPVVGPIIGDNDIFWQDDGPERDCWDMEAAAQAGWQLKAQKRAGTFDMTRGGNNYQLDQVYRHCMDMANQFQSTSIA